MDSTGIVSGRRAVRASAALGVAAVAAFTLGSHLAFAAGTVNVPCTGPGGRPARADRGDQLREHADGQHDDSGREGMRLSVHVAVPERNDAR